MAIKMNSIDIVKLLLSNENIDVNMVNIFSINYF